MQASPVNTSISATATPNQKRISIDLRLAEFEDDFEIRTRDGNIKEFFCKTCNLAVQWERKTRVMEHLQTKKHLEAKSYPPDSPPIEEVEVKKRKIASKSQLSDLSNNICLAYIYSGVSFKTSEGPLGDLFRKTLDTNAIVGNTQLYREMIHREFDRQIERWKQEINTTSFPGVVIFIDDSIELLRRPACNIMINYVDWDSWKLCQRSIHLSMMEANDALNMAMNCTEAIVKVQIGWRNVMCFMSDNTTQNERMAHGFRSTRPDMVFCPCIKRLTFNIITDTINEYFPNEHYISCKFMNLLEHDVELSRKFLQLCREDQIRQPRLPRQWNSTMKNYSPEALEEVLLYWKYFERLLDSDIDNPKLSRLRGHPAMIDAQARHATYANLTFMFECTTEVYSTIEELKTTIPNIHKAYETINQQLYLRLTGLSCDENDLKIGPKTTALLDKLDKKQVLLNRFKEFLQSLERNWKSAVESEFPKGFLGDDGIYAQARWIDPCQMHAIPKDASYYKPIVSMITRFLPQLDENEVLQQMEGYLLGGPDDNFVKQQSPSKSKTIKHIRQGSHSLAATKELVMKTEESDWTQSGGSQYDLIDYWFKMVNQRYALANLALQTMLMTPIAPRQSQTFSRWSRMQADGLEDFSDETICRLAQVYSNGNKD